MNKEGPIIEHLTHRLAECPPEFLAEPKVGDKGSVHVEAVVSDLLLDVAGIALVCGTTPAFVRTGKHQRNYLRLVLVCSWLLHDAAFLNRPELGEPIYTWLQKGLDELAALVGAEDCVTDPDRREELARLCLDGIGLLPKGETPELAADRLSTLSSVYRARVIRETKAHRERVERIRRQMQEKAAREAAAKAIRE
ncbi:MAG: hypothetical protein JXR37_13305 [Kiritimatiellae bacterium]|nr:hypothetical protein [Kiritimatiellia bacterium]